MQTCPDSPGEHKAQVGDRQMHYSVKPRFPGVFAGLNMRMKSLGRSKRWTSSLAGKQGAGLKECFLSVTSKLQA